MSFWANCLWYNLFNTFEDWKNNWVKEMREEPDEELVREAKLYFAKLDKVCNRCVDDSDCDSCHAREEIMEHATNGNKCET